MCIFGYSVSAIEIHGFISNNVCISQVTLIDGGGILSSYVTLVALTVQLLNDEPPRVTNTAFNQTYKEEAGSISITDYVALIEDNDNLERHRAIARITVTLLSPLPEDVLIANGSVVENSTIEWTCDDITNACYVDFLRSLQYDNTSPEPSIENREVVIEVSDHLHVWTCLNSVFAVNIEQ